MRRVSDDETGGGIISPFTGMRIRRTLRLCLDAILGDTLLINRRTGRIVQVVYGVFCWDLVSLVVELSE